MSCFVCNLVLQVVVVFFGDLGHSFGVFFSPLRVEVSGVVLSRCGLIYFIHCALSSGYSGGHVNTVESRLALRALSGSALAGIRSIAPASTILKSPATISGLRKLLLASPSRSVTFGASWNYFNYLDVVLIGTRVPFMEDDSHTCYTCWFVWDPVLSTPFSSVLMGRQWGVYSILDWILTIVVLGPSFMLVGLVGGGFLGLWVIIMVPPITVNSEVCSVNSVSINLLIFV
ncbi:hypothetical protein D9758_003024 [Tetrapyrgos nigripes]|uniref:Uncharacterized protein n=1 Tax=Tetrapyrgos nigripes TaxID=182062 RepID=A0A8H5LTM2_9AGAR|nr:hypothetical protein D9758_003024 [Tetrapyrgos nigripes]